VQVYSSFYYRTALLFDDDGYGNIKPNDLVTTEFKIFIGIVLDAFTEQVRKLFTKDNF